jgi:hypothetical protein
MARSTKAEILRRVGEIFPLVCDCLTLREIRAYVERKTAWGSAVSDSTLKYYTKLARQQLKEAARFDRAEEIGAAKRRLERIIARSAAKGELRTLLVANKQLTELLGLAAPTRSEVTHSGALSLDEKKRALVDEITKEVLADVLAEADAITQGTAQDDQS